MTTAGDVKVVTGVGNLPPLAGTQSLLVAPNASATLHLARPSGASAVRLSLQRLASVNYTVGSSSPISAGVIGGTARITATFSSSSATPTMTGDTTWPYATPKEELTMPLMESGSDVVVRIAPFACNGLCPPAQALLIDDLRIE